MKPPAIKKIGIYEVKDEIGSGGFSTVFKCVHEDTGALCAVKIGNMSVWREYEKKKNRVETMVHMEEWAAYRSLKYGKGEAQEHGIPAVYETGLVKLSEKEIYPYLIMQLLGRHIGRELTKSTFTKIEFFTLARKMLRALQFVHESGLVHRDIKPSNFCTEYEPGGNKHVYLLDMGMKQQGSWQDRPLHCFHTVRHQQLGSVPIAFFWIYLFFYHLKATYLKACLTAWSSSGNHCLRSNAIENEYQVVVLLRLLWCLGFACKQATPEDEKFGDFVGTPDYSSSPALRGYRQGPRDDLESLGYGFLEMWLGDLPWYLTSDFSAEGGWTAQSLEIMADRRDKKWKSMAEGNEVPEFLVKWIEYSKNLTALSTPSYSYLRSLMSEDTNAEAPKSKRKSLASPGQDVVPVNPSKKIRVLEPEE